MKRIYLLLFLISAVCFFSCRKDNTSPQALIVGKWILQQQHVVMTIDNVTKTDTILTASAITHATAQFNKDGTYSSASVYMPANNSLNTFPGPSTANNTGKYSYSGSVFTVVPGLAGWFNFGVGTSSPPTGVSSSIQVTQLDGSHLTIHAADAFTVTNGTGQHTYSELFDFYYSK